MSLSISEGFCAAATLTTVTGPMTVPFLIGLANTFSATSSYNNSTHTYTSPADKPYLINTSVLYDTTLISSPLPKYPQQIFVYINLNGVRSVGTQTATWGGIVGQYVTVQFSQVLELKQGNTISVEFESTLYGGQISGEDSFFSVVQL